MTYQRFGGPCTYNLSFFTSARTQWRFTLLKRTHLKQFKNGKNLDKQHFGLKLKFAINAIKIPLYVAQRVGCVESFVMWLFSTDPVTIQLPVAVSHLLTYMIKLGVNHQLRYQ